jgi:hypothetical protein
MRKCSQDIRLGNRRIKEQAKTPIAKCKMKNANFKMSDPENFAFEICNLHFAILSEISGSAALSSRRNFGSVPRARHLARVTIFSGRRIPPVSLRIPIALNGRGHAARCLPLSMTKEKNMHDDYSGQMLSSKSDQSDLKLADIIDTEDENADSPSKFIEMKLRNVMTQSEMETLTIWFPKAARTLARVLRNRPQ